MIGASRIFRAKMYLRDIIACKGLAGTAELLGYTYKSVIAWAGGTRNVGDYACRDIEKAAILQLTDKQKQWTKEYMLENPRIVQNNYSNKLSELEKV